MPKLSFVAPGDWVAMAARADHRGIALRSPDGSVLTHVELEARASTLAAALEERGIRHGDVIAVLGTDSVDYVTVVFAALKLGAVTVPLNFRLTAAELSALVATADPKALFLDERYRPLLDELRGAAPSLELVVGLGSWSTPQQTVAELVDAHPRVDSFPARTTDDDIVFWMLTSGTTGTPRIVAQSARMLKANSAKGVVEQGFRPDDTLYAGSPMFHVAGMGWVFYALSRGAAVMIVPQFDIETLVDLINRELVTRCLLVPSMVVQVLDHAALTATPRLRSLAYGGAAMPPELVRRLLDRFDCDLYNTFGAGTEGGGQTVLRPEDHRLALRDGHQHVLGSIGRPQYGVDLELRDPQGLPVPVGEVGEICTRSDTVMDGYVGQEELTKERVKNGWIGNGDLAWQDQDGYLYLAGRKDDMILRGGENIYPSEVENALIEHPAVAEVTVVGIADEQWGHVVAAAVVVRAGQLAPDPDELLLFSRERLAGYKVPSRIHIVEELPRNGAGKTLRSEVRKLFLAADRASC